MGLKAAKRRQGPQFVDEIPARLTTDPSPLLVASARTALMLALRELQLDPARRILVPEFVCDVVVDAIRQCGLAPRYYSTTRNLVPDWEALEVMAAERSCSALVMVHYFGQPQDVTQFRAFCGRHDLVLIEDNAHGHGGYLGGNPLGTLGNVGISSPRKILGTPSGGALYGAGPGARRVVDNLRMYPIHHPVVAVKAVLRSIPVLRRRLKSWIDQDSNWSDPHLHREVTQTDYAIDVWSRQRIVTADWKAIAAERRARWSAWAQFAQRNGGELLFARVHPESCPWALPVYVRDMSDRNAWLQWGAKNRISIFPWPTLPEEVIASNGVALARWQKILCISLEVGPVKLGPRISSTTLQ